MGRKKKDDLAAFDGPVEPVEPVEPNGNVIDSGLDPLNDPLNPPKARKPRKASEPKSYRLEKRIVRQDDGDSAATVDTYVSVTPDTFPSQEDAQGHVVSHELTGVFRVTRIIAGDTFESKLRASIG